MAWLVYLGEYLVWLIGKIKRRLRRPPLYVSFLLEGPDPDLPSPPASFWQRRLWPHRRGVLDLQRQLRSVAADSQVRGIVLHLRPASYTAAQAATLRGLIEEARASGKRVICWAPSYSADTYPIACAADEILLQPGGMVAALGVGRRHLFLADALRRLGVDADFVQVSPYKTAADVFSRRDISPEAKEMADWLADSAFDEMVAAVAAGRHMDSESVRRLIDGSPYVGQTAVDKAMVDAVIGEEDLPDRLGGSLLPWNRASRSLPVPRPCRPGRYVGLMRVEGMIVDGRSRRLPLWPTASFPLLLEPQSGDLTVVQQARQLAQNRRVGAVLLWVDSRGGSASASEAMHAALKALAHRKPLVAAMGSVAASGGYYIAAPARRIFAQPGTLTGSIGVLAGKLTFGGLLDLLLVNRQTTTRGENVFMDRPDQMYTDRERTLVHEMIDRIYDLFLDRVCQGRNRSRENIEPLAGGRVWTGRQALARGLVDEMGGLPQALAAARSLGNLPEDAPLLELPLKAPSMAPASPASSIEHALRAVEALGRTGAWLLSPLISAER